MRRIPTALLFFAPLALAQNVPRFAFTFPDSSFSPTAVAVDLSGNTYLTGGVAGNPFAATPGAYQSQNDGGTCYGGGGIGPPAPIHCRNAFVIKLDPSGAVVFATYLGGTADANGTAIAVDSQQNVYVAGTLANCCFPFTPGAAFGNSAINDSGSVVGFIAKLNAAGTELEYATLVPATLLTAIALDTVGDVYFTGAWDGPGAGQFPTTPGAFQTAPLIPATASNQGEAVVGELNSSGSALLYGTYLSGSQGVSSAIGIAVDSSGNALVAGSTQASDFPATSGQFTANSSNLFLAKLSASGSNLLYSTLLGAASAGATKVGPAGDIYIACQAAANFPVTAVGFGVAPAAGNYDNFLLHVSNDGSSVADSIYLPFTLAAAPAGALDVDAGGNAYVVGYGSIMPTAGAFQTSAGDEQSPVVVAKITPNGGIAGATYLGASAGNSVTGIAAERDGSVVVAGQMGGIDFPPGFIGNVFLAANFFPGITLENSASFVANTVVPGELVSIQGYGIGPSTANAGAVQVSFGDFSAPVSYAQAQQINVQVPWEISGQSLTQVQITYNGQQAGSVTVPIAAAQPGIFYVDNSDGSVNSPSNPAHAGDYISIYGTGGGVMGPAGLTGGLWPLNPLSSFTQPVSVSIGGEAAGVLYGGSAPTLGSGFFQINVQLPSNLASTQPVRISIGGASSVPFPVAIH